MKYKFNKNYIFLGFFLVTFSSILVLSLAIMKGYFLWNMSGDPSDHINKINYILKYGFFEKTNFYPILHIFSSQFLIISDISLNSASWILPLFFEILCIPFVYVLSNSILKDYKKSILATIFSCTLILGWYISFTPNHLANLFFPLVMMILIKSILTEQNRIQWRILLIIMVFLLPPFHPVVAISMLLIVASLLGFAFFSEKYSKRKDVIINISLTLIILVGVWTITWISSFYLWDKTLINIHTLISEGGPTSISKLSNQAAYANNLGYNIVEYGLKTYGGPLFFIIMSVLAFPIIWKERKNERMKNLLMLYFPLIILGITLISFYFLNLFGPTRMLIYITYFCIIISGFFLYKIIGKIKSYKNIYLSAIALILLLIFVNGSLTTYPSHYSLSTSLETSKSEIIGFNWFFEDRNVKTPISGISIDPDRFAAYLGINQKNIIMYKKNIVPYHFGYNNSTSLSEFYDKNVYLILTQRDKTYYIDVFPELANIRWSTTDFEKLNYDQNVNKLYSNGEFDTWLIIKK
ncbi:hypothetical protein A994_02728 [Methanobacterium formicicum DSM 3637]|uniref:Glycosyltransferase RgtA/B/C/D-like domain-containing protein n=2 Tax=Methanobacterium formicicum TaxID=2162 RepID=K2R5A5_METFP|nr:hypothetical protein A994_02728 [Methanobacterium formicicum DSM 3637]